MSTSVFHRELESSVCEWHEVPDEVRRLASIAMFDLYHGPIYSADGMTDEERESFPYLLKENWPGFVEAVRIVCEWADEWVVDLYADEDGLLIGDTDPQSDDGNWDEEYGYVGPDPYYLVDRRQILEALFGSELAGHLI